MEHYKPGAFTSRRNGSEDARRATSLDGGNRRGNSGGKSETGKENNFEGNKSGSKGGNQSSGGYGTGKRGKKHDESNRGRKEEDRGRRADLNEDWRAGTGGPGKGKKKPDIEPYVPKKIQEHREGKSDEGPGKGDSGKKDAGLSGEGSKDVGAAMKDVGGGNKEGGGVGTGRKKNKKKKNKGGAGNNSGGTGGGGGGSEGGGEGGLATLERKKGQKNDERERPEGDKDISKRNNKRGDRVKDKKNAPDLTKSDSQVINKGEKNKDLRETLDLKKAVKISGSQSNPDFKTSVPKNDDINPRKVSQDQARKDKKGGNYERYDAYDMRSRNNRHSYHENYDRRDHFKIPENTKGNQRFSQNYDEYSNYNRGRGGGQKDFRRGQSFGQEYDRRGESEPKENGFKNFDSRSSSPQNWNWRGRGRGGNYSRGNSRVSSPTRSQRGKNSRNSSPQSSRGNSRRNSPTSFDHSRTNSPVRHTRVFRRNTSPPRGSRSTMSRTPSPPHSLREGFGRGGGRGSSHTLGRHGQNKRDSRDLDGWSRQDNFDRSNPR